LASPYTLLQLLLLHLMELRNKRSAHPGYALTGGPPKSRAAPGTKTSKQVAKEAKAAKAMAMIDGLKKIAGAEKENTAAFAADDTPRAPAARTRGGHCSTASELSELGSAESGSEAQTEGEGADASDGEGEVEQSDAPDLDRDVEGSEPPSDLERTIKKSSKGKQSVRGLIEEMKNDDDMEVDEGPDPQDTPLVTQPRPKRLRAESVRIAYFCTAELKADKPA
jgi:hypothetical protein